MDKESGLVHIMKGTSANVHDVTMIPELLTGEETVVYGDSGYLGDERCDGICKFFDEGTSLCSIYENRPIQCNVDAMYEAYFFNKMTKEE